MVPLFYDRTRGVPVGWVDPRHAQLGELGPQVTAARMVRDYTTELYEPAARSSNHLGADGAAAAIELATWRARIEAAWPGVRVDEVDLDESGLDTGAVRDITVRVERNGLSPDDVQVEVVHGATGHDGAFDGAVTREQLTGNGDGVYQGSITATIAGGYGVTARVLPRHPDLASPHDLGLVAWA